MKWWFSIGCLLIGLAMMVASCETPKTSPRPSPRGEGVASRTLEEIDSLMWRQPDSAFAMLQEFASSAASDSLDEFNGHHCQLLISELLFKNNYAQSNRAEVLQAVGYFDSIDDAFLAARAHYIKGVGYYEHDSLVEACTEYLNTLRIMEIDDKIYHILAESFWDVDEAHDNGLKMAIAYPNPGKDVLNIRTGLKDAWAEVYDMNGRLIHSQALTENVTAIDATDWAAGVYIWKVYANNKEAENGKWIKE